MINIKKSSIFVLFLLWAILAQTDGALKKMQTKDLKSRPEANNDMKSSDTDDVVDESEDESSDEEDNENKDAEYPSLSCILFQVRGCHSECLIKAKAFNQLATGQCSHNNFCQCMITQDPSFDALWKKKFGYDTADIRKKIQKDVKLYKQVRKILQKPFTTAEQTKSELKSVLTETEYNRLHANEANEASKMIKNGQVDQAVVQKFVSEELPFVLGSFKRNLVSFKYEPQLHEVLQNYKGEDFKRLTIDVRRTLNKSLIDILEKYLKENLIQQAEQDDAKINLPDTISYYVIDEFVKNIDKARSQFKRERAPSKKYHY